MLVEANEAKTKQILTTKIAGVGIPQQDADYMWTQFRGLAVHVVNATIEHMKETNDQNIESRRDNDGKFAFIVYCRVYQGVFQNILINDIVAMGDYCVAMRNQNLQPQFAKNMSFEEMAQIAAEWHEGDKDIEFGDIEEHEIILSFQNDNGLGFYWVDLGTNSDAEESRRMGHCGADGNCDTLYSLREFRSNGSAIISESHVTAAVGNYRGDNVIIQMKGKNNYKPSDRYHPYIAELLVQHSEIEGVVPSSYRPEDDFRISDMDSTLIRKVLKARGQDFFKHRSDKRLLQEMGFDVEIPPSMALYTVDIDEMEGIGRVLLDSLEDDDPRKHWLLDDGMKNLHVNGDNLRKLTPTDQQMLRLMDDVTEINSDLELARDIFNDTLTEGTIFNLAYQGITYDAINGGSNQDAVSWIWDTTSAKSFLQDYIEDAIDADLFYKDSKDQLNMNNRSDVYGFLEEFGLSTKIKQMVHLALAYAFLPAFIDKAFDQISQLYYQAFIYEGVSDICTFSRNSFNEYNLKQAPADIQKEAKQTYKDILSKDGYPEYGILLFDAEHFIDETLSSEQFDDYMDAFENNPEGFISSYHIEYAADRAYRMDIEPFTDRYSPFYIISDIYSNPGAFDVAESFANDVENQFNRILLVMMKHSLRRKWEEKYTSMNYTTLTPEYKALLEVYEGEYSRDDRKRKSVLKLLNDSDKAQYRELAAEMERLSELESEVKAIKANLKDSAKRLIADLFSEEENLYTRVIEVDELLFTLSANPKPTETYGWKEVVETVAAHYPDLVDMIEEIKEETKKTTQRAPSLKINRQKNEFLDYSEFDIDDQTMSEIVRSAMRVNQRAAQVNQMWVEILDDIATKLNYA